MANPSLSKLRKLQEEAQAFLHERTLPVADDGELGRFRNVLLFCARVYHGFVRNRCPSRAAALSYTNLLALVPLLAVVVSVSATFIKSQGPQSIQDWIREAIVRVAPMLGLKEAAEEVTPFAAEDLRDRDFENIVTRLETGSSPLSRYLWDSRFVPDTKNIITNQTLPLDQRKHALVAEFNKVVQGSDIFEAQRFSKIALSKRTRALLDQNPTGEELAQLNHSLLSDAYPLGEDPIDAASSQITDFVSNFQSGRLGVSAVLALIFVAISLLSTIETTFNDMWGVTRGRGWFSRVVQYWAALTLGPMFLFSALTLTTWAKISHDVVEQLPLVRILVPFIVPLVILSAGCALLYLVMPNTRVPWVAAILGGLTAGALLQLNSLFNVMYVSRVLTYRQIYGSMAALPLFLLGLYFAWLLVLLGAQVTYTFQNRQAYIQERKAETINQRGREFVAVRLMTCVAQRFHDAEKPPTANEMAEHLRIPLRLVGHVITALTTASLVLEVSGREVGYAPGRPLHQITVRDILDALRVRQGQELAICKEDTAAPVLQREFQTIEHAWAKAAGGLTLEDLVNRVAGNGEPVAAEHPT
jgi:membrane protein